MIAITTRSSIRVNAERRDMSHHLLWRSTKRPENHNDRELQPVSNRPLNRKCPSQAIRRRKKLKRPQIYRRKADSQSRSRANLDCRCAFLDAKLTITHVTFITTQLLQ